MKLSQLIKNYRNENGVTLDELAQRSGLSKPYISMLEKGKNPKSGKPIIPSYDTLRKVANAMDMPTADFVKLIEPETMSLEGAIQTLKQHSPIESHDFYTVLKELDKRLHCGIYTTYQDQPLSQLNKKIIEQSIWHLTQTIDLLISEENKK